MDNDYDDGSGDILVRHHLLLHFVLFPRLCKGGAATLSVVRRNTSKMLCFLFAYCVSSNVVLLLNRYKIAESRCIGRI